MIIGVDHGYADVKTANFVFAKSVVPYEKEPPFLHDTVLFGGKYYCCGGERDTLIKDKTSDESYYTRRRKAMYTPLTIILQSSLMFIRRQFADG